MHHHSEAVGLNLGFDSLASDTNDLSVLASVRAEGNQGADTTSEDEAGHTPDDCDTADFLSGHISSVSGA